MGLKGAQHGAPRLCISGVLAVLNTASPAILAPRSIKSFVAIICHFYPVENRSVTFGVCPSSAPHTLILNRPSSALFRRRWADTGCELIGATLPIKIGFHAHLADSSTGVGLVLGLGFCSFLLPSSQVLDALDIEFRSSGGGRLLGKVGTPNTPTWGGVV